MLDFADEATRAVMHLLGFGALCIVLLSRFCLVHNCAHTFHFISFRLVQSRHCCCDRICPILSRSHIPPLHVTQLLLPVSVHTTHTHTHTHSLSLFSPTSFAPSLSLLGLRPALDHPAQTRLTMLIVV